MNLKKIYRKIAKKNNVTVDEIKSEIENAINAAWENSQKTEENIIYQRQVREDGSVPTLEELILFFRKKKND